MAPAVDQPCYTGKPWWLTGALRLVVYFRVPVETDRSPLRAELDRVGASFAKAGVADCISVQLGVDEMKLLEPPRARIPAARGSASATATA